MNFLSSVYIKYHWRDECAERIGKGKSCQDFETLQKR